MTCLNLKGTIVRWKTGKGKLAPCQYCQCFLRDSSSRVNASDDVLGLLGTTKGMMPSLVFAPMMKALALMFDLSL